MYKNIKIFCTFFIYLLQIGNDEIKKKKSGRKADFAYFYLPECTMILKRNSIHSLYHIPYEYN